MNEWGGRAIFKNNLAKQNIRHYRTECKIQLLHNDINENKMSSS